MSRGARRSARLTGVPAARRRWAAWLCCGLVWLAADAAIAFEREIKSRIANYDEAPVTLRTAQVKLVQTYSDLAQAPFMIMDGKDTGLRRSRVRHLNRLNEQIPTYLLQGALELRNETRRSIDMLQLTTVFFNAFRERIRTDRDAVQIALVPRQRKTLAWSKGVPHEEVFEMVVVISAVRFTDGSVWSPTEELIVLP